MDSNCIYSIDLTTSNNDILSIPSDDFKKFYISNIDDNGDEISYMYQSNSNILYANFFMVKLLITNETEKRKTLDRIEQKNDIVKISLKFTNGLKQEFELPKKRTVNNGKMENKYQKTFYDEEGLCILICDKRVRFIENLFI